MASPCDPNLIAEKLIADSYSLGIIACIVQRQSFDAEYVQRLRNFDNDTELDFVAYFTELLAIKLRSRLRSQDQVEDVIQETFVRVLKTLRGAGVDNPGALGSFV